MMIYEAQKSILITHVPRENEKNSIDFLGTVRNQENNE